MSWLTTPTAATLLSEEADHRVHRERNYDGAVFSSSDVDVRREDRKQLEEDTVV